MGYMIDPVAVVALAISIFTFVWNNIVQNKEGKRIKKKETFEALTLLRNEALDQLAPYTKTQVEEISKNHSSEEYKKLAALLARCEQVALGVNIGIYDFAVVQRMMGSHFAGVYKKMKPLIKRKRSDAIAIAVKNGESPATSPPYSEFETLVNNLKCKKGN